MSPVATPRRGRHDQVGRGPIVGSMMIHVLAIGLAWWTSSIERQVPEFIVYEIELISPPAAELGDPNPPPPEELVIETPEEPQPEPEEEDPPPVIEEDPPPREEPKPEERAAPPEPEEAEDDPPPATSPNPDPDVETPGEDLNVRMEGVRRDYPEYYNNIIRQMQRCFRWRGSDIYSASIYFVINRDGTVSGIDVLESSKNTPFDIEAMGAAECAGTRGRLGPLPEELPYDQLPIRFNFGPKGGPGDSDSDQTTFDLDGPS